MSARADVRLAKGLAASILFHFAVIAGISTSTGYGGPRGGEMASRRFDVVLAGGSPQRPLPNESFESPGPAVAEAIAPAEDLKTPPIANNTVIAAETPDSASLPLLPPEPPFYALAELDGPPLVIRDIQKDPPELQSYPQGGKLIARLWIDETGRVVKAEIRSSDLPAAFAASARESFLGAVFVPAKKNGVAVRARVSVEVVYRPR